MTLEDRAEAIKTRQDFQDFLEHFTADLRENEDEWDNTDLGSYLTGFTRFAKDMDGYFENREESVDTGIPTWKLFAQMLLAASVYG
jgi:hypothetical protein